MRLLSAARPCVNMVPGKWSIGKGPERTHPTAGGGRGDPRCQGAGKILPRAFPSGLQWLRAVFKIKSRGRRHRSLVPGYHCAHARACTARDLSVARRRPNQLNVGVHALCKYVDCAPRREDRAKIAHNPCSQE